VSDLPYLPLWVAKYDARTAHLSLEEDGCYLRLLRLLWVTPGCRAPADRSWLVRRLRVDEATYDRVVDPILAEFFYKERGYWKNARLSEFYMQNLDVRRKRSEAGSKGGKNKALKDKDSEAGKRGSKDDGKSSANEKPGHGIPKPESIAIKKLSFLAECRRALGPGAPAEVDDDELDRVTTGWKALGATEPEIVAVIRRCTSTARKKPLRFLGALKREILLTIKRGGGTPQEQPAPRERKPLIVPDDPRAAACLHAIIERHGMTAAEAWLADTIAWTEDEVLLPTDYARSQVHERFGGELRNHGFSAALSAS
jgi:uncharacterized protein YdaU (DUF1376 family)